MKIARFFSVIFACVGAVLLVGSMGFFLINRNATVRILELPQEAVSCCDAFAQALNDGDLEKAEQLIYDQPDLGVSAVPADPENALVWDAFRSSISLSYSGECYAHQSGLARSGSITVLDVTGVTERLPEQAQSLMNQRLASAEDAADMNHAQNQPGEALVTQVLQEALQLALTQDAPMCTREVTVELINRDGSWWVVPDQGLLQALSGLA